MHYFAVSSSTTKRGNFRLNSKCNSDNNLNVAKWRDLFDVVENMGKGENTGLTLNAQSRLLTTLKKKALENTVGKGGNAGCQFILLVYIVVCKCFQFGLVWKLVVYQTFTTQSRLLTPLETKAFENIEGKEENAGNQHFLLFPQCFLLFPTQIFIFEWYLFCCLQMLGIWTSLNLCRLVKSWGLKVKIVL